MNYKALLIGLLSLSLVAHAMDISQKQIAQRTQEASYAIQSGDVKKAQELIVKGVDVDKKDMAGLSLLSYASRSGYLDIVKDLIAAGASKPYPLLEAATMGHTDVVEVLIDAGADVNTKPGTNSPLMNAAQGGHTKIVDMLIKAGAHLNAINEFRNTALILTLDGNTAKVLINAGADVNIIGNRNQTALNHALGNMELIKALRAAGATVSQNDFLAALRMGKATKPVLLTLINPVLSPETKEQIKTVLLIHKRSDSPLSVLPKDIIKLIIGYAFPEYIPKIGIDPTELANIEMRLLVDKLPLEQLAEAIKAGILDKDAVLKAWRQKIDELVKSLKTSYYVDQSGLQQLEKEIPAQIEAILK